MFTSKNTETELQSNIEGKTEFNKGKTKDYIQRDKHLATVELFE